MESLFVVTAIVAVTEFFKRVQSKDTYGALVIALAVVIGAVAGYFKVDGLTITNGIIAGAAACGIHTVATQIG